MGDEMKKMAGSKVKDILTSSPVTVTEADPTGRNRHHHVRKEFSHPAGCKQGDIGGSHRKKDIIRTLIN